MVNPTRRARPPLRTSKSGIAGLAVAVLATILLPIVVSAPALAQSQTGWHVEDHPTLFGPEQWWFHGDPGKGFGSNNYRYTYAIGGESEADNWAHWYMGDRLGTQEIQVYIPQDKATATVNYNIYKDNSILRKVQIDQSAFSGWTSLGRFAFNGADVVLAVFDNDAVQNYKRDGRSQSQIGVDAIRMRCVSNCATTPTAEHDVPTEPTPQSPQDEQKRVVISLGEDASGEGTCDRTSPCRWLNVTLHNFRGVGNTSYHCIRKDDRSDQEGIFVANGFRFADDSTRRTFNRICATNVALGHYVYIEVGGVRSNTIHMSDHISDELTDESCEESSEESLSPGRPRNVHYHVSELSEVNPYVTDDESYGPFQLVVEWKAPADDSGVQISGYCVRITDPNGGYWIGDFDTDADSADNWKYIPNLPMFDAVLADKYTVVVAAKNRYGTGPEVRATFGKLRVSPAPRDEEKPGAPENVALEVEGSGSRTRLVASWSPPENDGGAPITKYWIFLYRHKPRSERDLVSVATRSAGTANRRLTIERSPVFGANYVISVRAENEHGRGENTESRTSTVDCELIRNKWTRKKFGERTIFGRPVPGTGSHHVVAQVNFITIYGDEIRKGDRGGIVSSGNTNLSQTGCSWIYDGNGTRVVDSALVSGNAIVTGDGTQISGKAKVYGNARVYGGATVKGEAKVYGDAKVDGNIVLGGDVHVRGDAQLSGDVFEEISGGFWNGREEFIGPLEKQYDAFHKVVSDILKRCSLKKPPYSVRRYGWDGRQRVIERVWLMKPESVARDYMLVYLLGDGDTSDGDEGFLTDSENIAELCIPEEMVKKWFKVMIEFLPQPDWTLVFQLPVRVLQTVGLFLAMKSANDILTTIMTGHEIDGARRALSSHFIEVLIWCKDSFDRDSTARGMCERRLTNVMDRGEGDLDYVLDYLLGLSNENLRKLPEIHRDPPYHL